MYLPKELTQKRLPEIGDFVRWPRPHHRSSCRAQDFDARGKLAELNHTLHVLEQTLKG